VATKGPIVQPQAIHEPGEPWWNDIDRKYSDSSTRALWQSCQQSHLVAKQKELAKKMNSSLRIICVHTLKVFLKRRKILRHEVDGFIYPPKERVLRIFVSLKKSIALCRFEPANLRSNGKHANDYTTDDDYKILLLLKKNCLFVVDLINGISNKYSQCETTRHSSLITSHKQVPYDNDTARGNPGKLLIIHEHSYGQH
jgi:hypothetical protein